MEDKTLKITHTVHGTYKVTAERIAEITQNARDALSGCGNPDVMDEAFMAAIEKLPNDATDDMILHTIFGECTAAIFGTVAVDEFPHRDSGLYIRLDKIEYEVTPPKKDPPAGAIPQIVHVGAKQVQ